MPALVVFTLSARKIQRGHRTPKKQEEILRTNRLMNCRHLHVKLSMLEHFCILLHSSSCFVIFYDILQDSSQVKFWRFLSSHLLPEEYTLVCCCRMLYDELQKNIVRFYFSLLHFKYHCKFHFLFTTKQRRTVTKSKRSLLSALSSCETCQVAA